MYSVMLWAVFGDGGWKYGHVFRTGYMPYIEIRTRFRHLWVAFVGRMQYAPTAGYTCWFGIRTPLPNPVRATHRKTRPIFQHLADGGNHDREVWPTFGAVHFKNNVLKTYL